MTHPSSGPEQFSSGTIFLHNWCQNCPQLQWRTTNGHIYHSPPKTASASGCDWHSFPWSWQVKIHYVSLSHFPRVFMGPISEDSESCSCASISGTRRKVWLYSIVIYSFLRYGCGRILLPLWVITDIVEKLSPMHQHFFVILFYSGFPWEGGKVPVTTTYNAGI